MRTPETRSAYADLIIDASGHLWALQSRGRSEAGQPSDFVIFGHEGEWLGSVRLPSRFRVMEIGRDYVLGVMPDDLDVEAVQVLRLHRD